ncbi:hypothetical protein ACFVXG_07710 [Kitasatospora sp. NPDC058162]|uniref:hypothetical protein n=1 Tax=Kitasatospora sp. NPDC058162 TaxID=3346362 RepID=UPI0036DCCD6E
MTDRQPETEPDGITFREGVRILRRELLPAWAAVLKTIWTGRPDPRLFDQNGDKRDETR